MTTYIRAAPLVSSVAINSKETVVKKLIPVVAFALLWMVFGERASAQPAPSSNEQHVISNQDIELMRLGMIIYLRRSKTDQEGGGRKVGVPHGRSRWCPVAALEEWLARSEISTGPVFRPVARTTRRRARYPGRTG